MTSPTKSVLTILILLLTISVPTFSQYYTVKTKSSLTVREAPNAESQSKGTLPNGEIIFSKEIDNGWAKIEYKKGYGYVSMDFLEENVERNKINQEMLDRAEGRQGWWGKMLNWFNDRGFFGGLVLYLVIPFLLFVIFIGLPVLILSEIRFLNNAFFIILSYIYSIPACLLLWGNIIEHRVYSGVLVFWIVIFLLILLWFWVIELKKGRCPDCHSSRTEVIYEYMSNHYKKTIAEIAKDKYGREIDRRQISNMRSITHNKLRECKRCKCKWWDAEIHTS